MSYIFVSQKDFKEETIEFVERKGLGHPDSLADALAERLSVNYSRYTLKGHNIILHHNFDKIGILGGASSVSFGRGYLIQPIRVLLNGRASVRFGNREIPVKRLLIRWTREFFKEKFPMIDVKKDLTVYYNLSFQSSPGKTNEKGIMEGARKYWFQPRDEKDIPELFRLLSNDTSLGVGYAPLSKLEQLILAVEKNLTSLCFREKNPWIGTDIKILGFRDRGNFFITLCVPQIANYVPNIKTYKNNLEKVREKIFEIATKCGIKNLELNINTRDDYKTMELYLTAIGSSIESGDEGLVGRGNRVNGVISSMKPLSMEGVCGKNPVYHVGKLYNLAANKIAKDVYDNFKIPIEIYIASQSGRYLVDPWIILLRIPRGFNEIKALKNFVKERIVTIPELTNQIIHEEFSLC